MDTQRKVFPGILHHCYQNTVKGDLLFYTTSDYLVFFSHLCVAAKHYGVQVLSLALMPDHIHGSYMVRQREALSLFVGAYTRTFSRTHNALCHHDGPLFNSPFGSAPKRGDKAARSNLIYVGNNPVERRLVSRAEDYPWNFLAYATSTHPFSPELKIREASPAMRRAIQTVRSLAKQDTPLNYTLLQRIAAPLDRVEKKQLADFVVCQYNVIDYQAASRFFDSYDDMLAAMHASTGSEHDLNEIFIGTSDAYYAKMTQVIMREVHPEDIHDILGLSLDEKYALFQLLRKHTTALARQIAKYLRMPLEIA